MLDRGVEARVEVAFAAGLGVSAGQSEVQDGIVGRHVHSHRPVLDVFLLETQARVNQQFLLLDAAYAGAALRERIERRRILPAGRRAEACAEAVEPLVGVVERELALIHQLVDLVALEKHRYDVALRRGYHVLVEIEDVLVLTYLDKAVVVRELEHSPERVVEPIAGLALQGAAPVPGADAHHAHQVPALAYFAAGARADA